MANEQQPASNLIEQAAEKIEGIYSGRYTLGTDLAGPLRMVLTGLVATILERKDQERAAMRGLLERLVADFDPLFESYSTGPDEWLCPLCHQATPAVYDPPGQLAVAPEPFPHAETCVVAQASALLGRMETGKDSTP